VWVLTLRWGGVGAALAWAMLHSTYLVVGSWVTHARLAPALRWRWLLQDVGVPLACCAVVAALAWFGLASAQNQGPLDVLLGACLAALAAIAGLLSSAGLRTQIAISLRHHLRRTT